ncbi:hydantoinase/oxoprolinase N-terminal domain-containing protein [Haloechinothrix alba]|uniref:hydantoinase/oxoprolinase N-terminal domain-containing protein n=1 Tax=Haloechinothrix alba TaxID=664784 RepID=UPI0011309148|nr:hydantoinase/oxoprolinase N-terminal domain-containing protein [Haloechinothrix alba]
MDSRTVGVLTDGTGTVRASAYGFDVDRRTSIAEVLDTLLQCVSAESIGYVMITGLAEIASAPWHERLSPVGALRLAAPATLSVPPLSGWPSEKAAAVRDSVAVVAGGHQYDGTEVSALDETAVAAFAHRCRNRVAAVAITGANAQVDSGHEQRAAAIAREVLGESVPVVTSSGLGGMGLLERENTTVLDAALSPHISLLLDGVTQLLRAKEVTADIYFTSADGTLLTASDVARHPLRARRAARGAAITGALRLAALDDAVVVEAIDGYVYITTVVEGTPQENLGPVQVQGVRTCLPEVRTSAVRIDELRTRGTVARPSGDARLALRRARAGHGALPVIVVGPDADEVIRLDDGDNEIRPGFGARVGAIGAALGEVSGTVDRIFRFTETSYPDCVAQARRMARESAIQAGADPSRLRRPRVREFPLTYISTRCARMRVTVSGPLVRV